MSFPLRTIDLPADLLRVQGGSFRLVPEGEFSTGTWSTVARSAGPRQKRWVADLELVPFAKGPNGDLRFKWEAFIARLDGTAVAFRLWDPLRVLPRGTGAGLMRGQTTFVEHRIDGSYLVDGRPIVEGSPFAYVSAPAARYADALTINGLVASSPVFKVGDHISVGGNLYMIMDDAMSDSSGATTVQISWKLWKPALAGDRVDLYRPSSRFVLKSAEEGTMSRAFSTGSASFSAIEIPHVG